MADKFNIGLRAETHILRRVRALVEKLRPTDPDKEPCTECGAVHGEDPVQDSKRELCDKLLAILRALEHHECGPFYLYKAQEGAFLEWVCIYCGAFKEGEPPETERVHFVDGMPTPPGQEVKQ